MLSEKLMSSRLFFMAMYRFVEVESMGYGVYDLYPYIKDFVSSVGVENGLILVYAVDELCSILTIFNNRIRGSAALRFGNFIE